MKTNIPTNPKDVETNFQVKKSSLIGWRLNQSYGFRSVGQNFSHDAFIALGAMEIFDLTEDSSNHMADGALVIRGRKIIWRAEFLCPLYENDLRSSKPVLFLALASEQ